MLSRIEETCPRTVPPMLDSIGRRLHRLKCHSEVLLGLSAEQHRGAKGFLSIPDTIVRQSDTIVR
jgi:hypothetical protein